WMSGAVGYTPSLTRSGRPSATRATSSSSGVISTTPRLSVVSWASALSTDSHVDPLTQATDRARATGRLVHVHDPALHQDRARRRVDPGRHLGQEALEHRLRLDPEHGILGAAHPRIREVRRPPGENPLVGRLDVRVAPEDRRHLAVEEAPHPHLLR